MLKSYIKKLLKEKGISTDKLKSVEHFGSIKFDKEIWINETEELNISTLSSLIDLKNYDVSKDDLVQIYKCDFENNTSYICVYEPLEFYSGEEILKII